MKFTWKGVMPALTTQFDAQEQLDLNAFVHHLNAQIDAGIHGIVLGGTLGEASTLETAEKEALVKTACEITNQKIPVILNIAEQSTSNAIASVRQAEKNGADGFMVLPPMRYKATDTETVAYFKAIAAATELPIMIYNNPVDYKIEVTLDMFDQLSECPNINAVKESTRDVSNVTRMKNRFGNRFQIMCGVDTIAIESLMMGADGWIAGLVDAFPQETVAIYTYIQNGLYEKAVEVHRWFFDLLELDITPQLAQHIKQCEKATGLGTGYVRQPRIANTGAEKVRVAKIIDQALAHRPDISDYKSML
ncbi:MAG: dihydrodipicolinate synthase family protein [Bacteroidetes bacterium]|nr:dihydrodipicolinate synthase family protein [Bacteroidota bacterium]